MEAPFHRDLIRSGEEGKGGMSGGNQVKVRVTSSLPPPLWVYVPVLEIRFVWSLLFPASPNVCFVSSRKALKLTGLFSPIFGPLLVPPLHLASPPSMTPYLRLCRKREWHVIQLSLQVFCHQRTRWSHRGHWFTASLLSAN